MSIEKSKSRLLRRVDEFLPATPLWERVPTRSDSGELLNDFMMVIPKLKEQPQHFVEEVINKLESVLACYTRYIVFADLNLKLNVLWVSIKPSPGLGLEMAAAIHHCIPEAKLVAHKPER